MEEAKIIKEEKIIKNHQNKKKNIYFLKEKPFVLLLNTKNALLVLL